MPAGKSNWPLSDSKASCKSVNCPRKMSFLACLDAGQNPHGPFDRAVAVRGALFFPMGLPTLKRSVAGTSSKSFAIRSWFSWLCPFRSPNWRTASDDGSGLSRKAPQASAAVAKTPRNRRILGICLWASRPCHRRWTHGRAAHATAAGAHGRAAHATAAGTRWCAPGYQKSNGSAANSGPGWSGIMAVDRCSAISGRESRGTCFSTAHSAGSWRDP